MEFESDPYHAGKSSTQPSLFDSKAFAALKAQREEMAFPTDPPTVLRRYDYPTPTIYPDMGYSDDRRRLKEFEREAALFNEKLEHQREAERELKKAEQRAEDAESNARSSQFRALHAEAEIDNIRHLQREMEDYNKITEYLQKQAEEAEVKRPLFVPMTVP